MIEPAARGAPVTSVVRVTGAAGGIGRAVVARFVASGYAVDASDLVPPASPPPGPHWAALDATDEAAVEAYAAERLASRGRLDAVVHLVGRTGAGPLHATPLGDWRSVLDANLTSAFLVARAAHAGLRASHGALVLTASTNALNGGSALSGPAYAVAKAGIVNLARYLAKEWAPDGIRVNCVAPGPVATPMLDRLGAERIAALAAAIPLGRVATPDDVAATIEFLCSPAAGYLTGTVHNVSGGLLLD